jgi:micrococcal nuclease
MTEQELIKQNLWHYKAKVVSVYDGDTCTVDLSLGFHIHMSNQKIRLYGIDTPELRGEDRKRGLIVRDIVSSMILNKEIILHTIGKDKSDSFGRWLGIIYIDGLNLNQWLVDNGYAIPYRV